MRNRHFIVSMLLAISAFCPGAVGASPVLFNLTLQVTDVFQTPSPACSSAHNFGCSNAPGDIHVGSFFIDSIRLSPDGTRSGGVSNFFLHIGNVTWDQTRAAPLSDFAGFINGLGLFGQSSFDIDVLGGTIAGLRGGVHGPAGLPAIDFNVRPGGFEAVDIAGTGIGGSLRVNRVPEPSLPALLAISIAPLVWIRFRRRSAPASATASTAGTTGGSAAW